MVFKKFAEKPGWKKRCSAGVMLAWPAHLHVQGLPTHLHSVAYPSVDIASRFVCVLLRLKSVTVAVCEVYLHTGEGVEGRNLDLLFHVAKVGQLLGVQVVLMGDFQATPLQLAASSWLQVSGLHLLSVWLGLAECLALLGRVSGCAGLKTN